MNTEKLGILLVNLGSPAAPTTKAVKNYLAQFLSDSRVVNIPKALWMPILHGIILNTRPKKVAVAYQSIWGGHKTSPLVRECENIKNALSNRLGNQPTVVLGMRYGEPSIDTALKSLKKMDKIVVLPLFPQFSSATTASVFDTLGRYYQKKRQIPSISFIQSYHDHPLYIKALADSVRHYWAKNTQAKKLIISFHGLPKFFIDQGDPYQKQCEKTAQLLGKELNSEYILSFQSRFGKTPWLKPYLVETLEQLAKDGVKTLDIISPGFSADCLETLEELAIAGKEIFIKAGGENLSYIPALNSSETHLDLIEDLTNQFI